MDETNGAVETSTVDAPVEVTESSVESTEQVIEDIGNPLLSTDGESTEPEEVTETENPLLADNDDEDKENDIELPDLDEGENVIAGVDLSELEEYLDFETPEARESIAEEVEKLKELGFNEDQIKAVAKMQIETYQSAVAEREGAVEDMDEETELSPAEIKANLENNLTSEEKRNYKTMYHWMRESVDTEKLPDESLRDWFKDPSLVKVVHELYKKAHTSPRMRDINEPRAIEPSKPKTQVTATQASEFYREWLGKQDVVSREESIEQIKKLEKMVKEDDKQTFSQIFKGILNT